MKDIQTAELTTQGPLPGVSERTFQLATGSASARNLATEISVFEAKPQDLDRARGGIVLIQEIFGVNEHIRNVARRYAAMGFLVWAPAFFDHVEKGIELSYEGASFAKGCELVGKVGWDQSVDDVRFAAEGLRPQLRQGKNKIAVVGYCWGGSVAYIAACRLPGAIDAAVGYYGGQIAGFKEEKPVRPTLLHFGKRDAHIDLGKVESIRKAQPQVPVHLYDADHGFNCDARSSFNPGAAAEALQRSLAFLSEHGL